MSEKTFTLEEANLLLPILESLLRQAMDAKDDILITEKEFADLGHRIFLSGGLLLDVEHWAKRKAVRERAVQQIKDAVEEINATGVQVKDIDVGLLDFPCLVDGETVLLCWKLGEPHRIAYWHGTNEGFAGRKPIATLSLRKKPNSEKPN